MTPDRLVIAPEVAEALRDGAPVVALESTLISHGLPYPQNIEVASASEAAIRESGAVPATVAIHDGRVLVGLDAAAFEALATAPKGSVRKAARPSFAIALAEGGWAATTVSATMIAAEAAGIHVFATGGIGGVHRGALGRPAGSGSGSGASGSGSDPGASRGDRPPSFDISSDLQELARTAVAVVCAGPKAILDVPATLEYLETHGVPVLAVGQEDVPGFYARSSGIRAMASVPDIAAAARYVALHFAADIGGGLLVCTPPPEDVAIPEAEARSVVEQAVREADEAGIEGPAVTPWLLQRIAVMTEGRFVRTNTALILNDAWVAGRLAVSLASLAGT